MAATHKKELLFLFFLDGAKKEGGTCAMLIRESHMVESREEKRGEKNGKWRDRVKKKRYGTFASLENTLRC